MRKKSKQTGFEAGILVKLLSAVLRGQEGVHKEACEGVGEGRGLFFLFAMHFHNPHYEIHN